jgi:hypothetical protein
MQRVAFSDLGETVPFETFPPTPEDGPVSKHPAFITEDEPARDPVDMPCPILQFQGQEPEDHDIVCQGHDIA